MSFKDNDLELLALIDKNETNALTILIEKYSPLIKNRIRRYNIDEVNLDDYFQEGVMILLNCVKDYQRDSKKTFNKYFDSILQYRIIDMIRKTKKSIYEIKQEESMFVYEENKLDRLIVETSDFTDFESDVYKLRFVQNYKIEEITRILNCDTKKIYNTIAKIKEKLKISVANN